MIEAQNDAAKTEALSNRGIVDLAADPERWAAAQAKVAEVRAQAAIEKAAAMERMRDLSFNDVQAIYNQTESFSEKVAALEIMMTTKTSFVL